MKKSRMKNGRLDVRLFACCLLFCLCGPLLKDGWAQSAKARAVKTKKVSSTKLATEQTTSSGNSKGIPSEQKILQDYSFEQLGEAANLLRIAADKGGNDSRLYCDLKPQEAFALIQPLKSLLDQKVQVRAADFFGRGQTAEKRRQQTKTCKAECLCGLYGSLFDHQETVTGNLSPEDEKISKDLAKVASELVLGDVVTCVEKKKWICQSSLMRFLRKEAEELQSEKFSGEESLTAPE